MKQYYTQILKQLKPNQLLLSIQNHTIWYISSYRAVIPAPPPPPTHTLHGMALKIGTHCVHVASLGRFTLASAVALRFWLARLRMFTCKQTDRARQADTILFIFFTIPTIQIIWQMRNSSRLHCFQKFHCEDFTIE